MSGRGAGRGRPRHPDVLTPAEWRVVDAIRHGLSNRAIAGRQGVSVDAVRFHVANVIAKLGLGSRAQVRDWAGVRADSALIARGRMTVGGVTHQGPAAERGAEVIAEDGLRLGPIGQVSRQVGDLQVAVHWYGTVLGLPHLYTFGDLAFFDCGGVRLFLSSAADERPPGQESVLYFQVPDIHQAYDELRARGVEFLGAPHLIHRHASGVEEWMAFFNDPEQRPLAIMAQTEAPAPTGSD